MDRCWWWSSPTTAGHSCTSASACCSSRWHFCPSNKKGKMQHLEIFRICLVAWADRSSLKISLKNISLIFQHIYIYRTLQNDFFRSKELINEFLLQLGLLYRVTSVHDGVRKRNSYLKPPRGGPHRPAVTIESCLASCWKHGYRSRM